MKSYQYPIEESWTKQEIIEVVHFFHLIENAYESAVNRNELLSAYRQFKKIVPSKSDEKTYFSQFETSSGYSSYHVIKKIKETIMDEISIRNTTKL